MVLDISHPKRKKAGVGGPIRADTLNLMRMNAVSLQPPHNVMQVKFLDCIDTEQHVCLVMEYCNGGNLGTYVAEKVQYRCNRTPT